MNKSLLFALLLSMGTTTLHAQRKNNVAAQPQLPAITVREAMSQYRFNDAEALLNNEITTLRKKKLDTSAAETKLRAVQRAKKRLNVTEKITFIDSIVVNKNEAFKYIFLGSETGKINSTNNYFSRNDSTECTVFLSQMQDHIVFAQPDANGTPRLYSSILLGNEWSAPVELNQQGLSDHADQMQNYPFMLSDGSTLYYAAKGEESIGGYDIFMTRYDADERRFLAPENIGMPFNSFANDYLYAVDEYSNIGWFVTDRNQTGDNVCVYTFIPNDKRRIYDVNEIGDDRLRSYALLSSIRDTWFDEAAISQARTRLAESRSHKSSDSTTPTFSLVINDQLTYTSLNDFRSAEARLEAEALIKSQEKLRAAENMLSKMRDEYNVGDANKRQQSAPLILETEGIINTLLKKIKQQEKIIRQHELNKQ